jgi:hypothetical protein
MSTISTDGGGGGFGGAESFKYANKEINLFLPAFLHLFMVNYVVDCVIVLECRGNFHSRFSGLLLHFLHYGPFCTFAEYWQKVFGRFAAAHCPQRTAH